MAPFKSTLARSVGKLLGVYKETDLSLRGDVQSSREIIIPEFFYEILIVAGGGGSDTSQPTSAGPGGNGSSGAGGGGVVHLEDVPSSVMTSGAYTFTLGAGGSAGANPASSSGTVGGDSTLANPGGTLITAKGGGVGQISPNGTDQQGGSSGGASQSSAPPNSVALQPTQPQDSNYSPFIAGGNGGYGNTSTFASPTNGAQPGGGGAGGAGSAGTGHPTNGTGGDGGIGIRIPFVIPGSKGTPGPAGSHGYFAGGGGGGHWKASPAVGGSGGAGGGGAGAPTGYNGGDGTANTGGGAGGAGVQPPGSYGYGANGGSGFIAIRYPIAATITAPTAASNNPDPASASFKIAYFESTGSHPITVG